MHSIDSAAAFSPLKFMIPHRLCFHSLSSSSLIWFIGPNVEKISLKCSALTFLLNPFMIISIGMLRSGESEKEDEEDNREQTLSLEEDLEKTRGEFSNDLPRAILAL